MFALAKYENVVCRYFHTLGQHHMSRIEPFIFWWMVDSIGHCITRAAVDLVTSCKS